MPHFFMVDKVTFKSLSLDIKDFPHEIRRQHESEVLALLKYRSLDSWTEKAFISLLFEINLLRDSLEKN